jgi:SAM-dependent methyltransferase
VVVVDRIFAHPRLAAVYDWFDDDRSDLPHYLAIVRELDAHDLLDLGCGTGVFAVLAAERGYRVTAVDPAVASLDVARARPQAGNVTWILGEARTLPPIQVDVVTMTGNVAQAIVDPDDWSATLGGSREALRPGGHLVFETRDPAFRGWTVWNRETSRRTIEIPVHGIVEHWVEVTDITWPLVTFRGTWIFHRDGAELTSDSTLRFRQRVEVEADLHRHGYDVIDIRDAPDRSGREFVFIARRPA